MALTKEKINIIGAWFARRIKETEDCKGWGKYQPIRKDETIGKD